MIIEKVNNGVYSQCRIPGIAVTEKGTLLAYYECRKTNSDWANIDIKVIRSTDEGETWETTALIEGGENTLNNPVMFVCKEKIHFLFLKNYKTLYHCVSTDDGMSFSPISEKSVETDFFYSVVAVGPGHGIVHNGKMIVPVWFAQNAEDEKAHRPSIIATLYSTDGEEWKVGEVIGKDILRNPSECALAVTAEGKVLISIRNENGMGMRAFSVSDDGISAWSEPKFMDNMPDPVCMGSMCHENGKIYHVNCNSKSAREDLTVKISGDCFKNYESIPVDSPAGYSDIAIKDGTIYVFYERDCYSGGLYFKKITL